MKYIIKNNIEKEIEAKDKDEAMALFYEELAQENSCLEHYITIEKK